LNIKKPIIVLVLIILIFNLLAGCIEIDKKQKNEKTEPFVFNSYNLNLNESKIITMDEAKYNVTIKKIESPRVTLIVNSEENLIIVNLGIPVEIDSDYDGRNELEINITKITPTNVSVDFKTISSTSKYVYIEDDLGILIKVPKQIDKIISLAPSVTEILFELGLGSKIIGKDSGSNYPDECKDIKVVSSYEGIDLEKILEKEPDIIFIDKTLDLSETNYNTLTEFGLIVFRVYPTNLQEVFDDIELLGKVTGRESKAEDIVNDLETRVDTVRTRGNSLSSKPIVLHVFYFDGSSSPWVATSSTFTGDLIMIAGGTPAVEDDQGFFIQITMESMIELNPDIIFTSQDDTWPTPSRQAIIDDEALQGITAVKNGDVIDVNADLVDRPGPRLVDGLELFSGHLSS
jgi:iron complex transport system substrate-binding protein